MFEITVEPRFYETDAFGHINNTVVTCWFETARASLFKIFDEQNDPSLLPLILARVEVDYVAQIYYGYEVTLRTAIERIGTASFVVVQEAWQQGQCVAKGKAVQVFFSHETQRSAPLPDHYRSILDTHRVPLPATAP